MLIKIISKFRDYYDSACAWGVDTTQLLKRSTSSFSLKDQYTYGMLYTRGIEAESGLLWFCGEVYPYICIDRSVEKPNSTPMYFYDIDSCIEYVEANYPKVIIYRGKSNPYNTVLKEEVSYIFNKRIPTSRWTKDSQKLDLGFIRKISEDNLCPYFKIFKEGRGDVVELYPLLKDINFQKVKDPYTAFQEIQSYKFGVLGCNEDEIVTISDKDRIAGKGFDTKYGFRTRPDKEK